MRRELKEEPPEAGQGEPRDEESHEERIESLRDPLQLRQPSVEERIS